MFHVYVDVPILLTTLFNSNKFVIKQPWFIVGVTLTDGNFLPVSQFLKENLGPK